MSADKRELGGQGRQLLEAHEREQQQSHHFPPQRREVGRNTEDDCMDKLWAHLQLMESEFNSNISFIKPLIKAMSRRSRQTATGKQSSPFGGRKEQHSKQLTIKQIHLHIKPHSSERRSGKGVNYPILFEQDFKSSQNEAMQKTFRPSLGSGKKLEESIYVGGDLHQQNSPNYVEILDHSEVWLPF